MGRLVLSRKEKERTFIVVPPSDTPTVIAADVVDIRGDKVRVLWEAQSDVSIKREEIAEPKWRELLAQQIGKPELLDDESLSPLAAAARAFPQERAG